MGLDMYLSKRHYVKRWNHMQPAELYDVTVKKGGAVDATIKPERVSYIVEDVAYWRKANAIHHWFVKNVQDGQDDCRDYDCSFEQLQELLEAVKAALANRKCAKKILPTEGGFFFGSTDYDAGYWQDLIETRDILTALLAEDGANTADYSYRASW